MTQLQELTKASHADLKVNTQSTISYAAKAHIMSIRVTEVGKAATSLPVFITKNQHNGYWGISVVTSVQPGRNLFIENEQWTASYQPTCMQTHPLYLMKSPSKENSYTIGVYPNEQDFSKDKGEALFDGEGKATEYLSRVTALLEADIKNDIHTVEFLNELDQMGLLKAIDLQVHYQEGSVQTIQGLYTINEEAMQLLSAEQLAHLNTKGYLAPIHAILLSILQLNSIVKKNNANDELKNIGQVKLETSKQSTAF